MLGQRPATVLIVDDTAENLSVLAGLLQPEFRVLAARSGMRALELATGPIRPDLILLDVMMPELDGFETFERLKTNPETAAIPVIFVTAMNQSEAELRGLAAGAVDYIAKPIVPAVVMARVRTHIELKRARDLLVNENEYLETEIRRRMEENDRTQQVTIRALAHLAETRDPETGNHILRTQNYVRLLATRLQNHPRFAPALSDTYIELLARSAPLHDIGKVGIPDHILLKPGKLTPDEWEIMKTHAQLGAIAIEQAEADVAESLPFLTCAKEIARWHHERWDGSGYPDGLTGDCIPISARLMALADVFDALVSSRVYKPAMSFPQAQAIILNGRGSHFDPDVLDAFMASFDDFCDIANRYRDTGHLVNDLAQGDHRAASTQV